MEEQKWTNKLVKKGKLDSPVVEATPFVFNDKLYCLDNWRKKFNHECDIINGGNRCLSDEVHIRDVDSNEIISIPLVGYGFAVAFVWEKTVYIFGGKFRHDEKWMINSVYMIQSFDLKIWSEPIKVLEAEPQENFYNFGVCHNGCRFVMLVETNDPQWPKFTFKYYSSEDLLNWIQIPGALYGVDKYVGGPALYFSKGYYYTLYLEELDDGWETRITRSKDLVTWEDAPEERAVIPHTPENDAHPLRGAGVKENNASDAEVCEWKGKTLAYFTGGDQQFGGDLQHAEFDGPMSAFLKHYFE